MAGVVRNLLILGGIVILAAGGAAAYVTLNTNTVKREAPASMLPPPPAPVAEPKASAETKSQAGETKSQAGETKSEAGETKPADAAKPEAAPEIAGPAALPDSTAGGSASPQDVATLEFVSFVQPFSLMRDSAAYVTANTDAPQMYPLRAGTGVMSAEKSRDGKWVIAMTADGQAAYLPAADLGPYSPSAAPKAELPTTVSGSATVVDTGTLTVDGQRVVLSGVAGRPDEYAQQLQALIDAQGPSVTCTPVDQAYVCKLPTGMDVARAALFNGAADIAPDASDDYRQQALAAKTAGRGIWRQQAERQ